MVHTDLQCRRTAELRQQVFISSTTVGDQLLGCLPIGRAPVGARNFRGIRKREVPGIVLKRNLCGCGVTERGKP